MSILAYLELKRELLDRTKQGKWDETDKRTGITPRMRAYCHKRGLDGLRDLNIVWRVNMEKETYLVDGDNEVFVSKSEKEARFNVICSLCLATNTVFDLKCRNCGARLKNESRNISSNE